VTDSGEHSNEPSSASTRKQEFLDQLNVYQCLKNFSTRHVSYDEEPPEVT
jgi:hypothetical protein